MENKFKKILTSRFILFALVIIFVWVSLVLAKMVYKKYELEKEINNLKAEIEKLDKSDQEMAQLIDYFGSQAFLEKEAKDKLNMKKEGESVVMVPEAGIAPEKTPLAQNLDQEKKEKNNFLKWWEYFFKPSR